MRHSDNGIVLVLVWFSLLGQAQALSQQNITLRVALIAPACEINHGKGIEVDFGDDILSRAVNGENYKKPLIFTLECNAAAGSAMRLRFEGSGASFDSAVVSTSMQDLGIRLLQGAGAGEPLALGETVSFSWPLLPVLQVVPVKRQGAVLSAGEFSGHATLIVEQI